MSTCNDITSQCANKEFTRSYSKGKSFSFSAWSPAITYTNDVFRQDFVTYDGDLYACIRTNTNSIPSSSDCWYLVVEKLPAKTFIPFVDDEGNISWELREGNEMPETQNIKGPRGEKGDKGDQGDPAVITGAAAYIDDGIGTPSVKVETEGSEQARSFSFYFSNLKGVQGPKGEKGDQGIQGEAGPQGIQGIQGEKGDRGTDGEKGEKGDKGEVGPQGEQGPQGIQGIQGEKGEKGDKGDQGDKGDKGDKGDTGVQGPKGDKGDCNFSAGEGFSEDKRGDEYDIYLDLLTGIFYQYINSSWTQIGQISVEDKTEWVDE